MSEINLKSLAPLRHRLSRNNFRKVFSDLYVSAWRHKRTWLAEGLREVRACQQASRFGPLWTALPLGAGVLLLGLVYGPVLGEDQGTFWRFLAAGLALWGLLYSCIREGAGIFFGRTPANELPKPPFSTPLFRGVWVSLLIFIFNLLPFLILSLWEHQQPGITLLWVPAVLALLLANGLWLGLVAGMINVRFPRLAQPADRLGHFLFLVTPVLWHPTMLPEGSLLVSLNPLYYLIEMVRAPLLGNSLAPSLLLGCLLITLIGWALTLTLLTLIYCRLPYWAWASSHRNHSPNPLFPALEQSVANLATIRAPDHVAAGGEPLDGSTLPVRAIAFYLPQFHPIPENDAWWGQGFTEWTNVTRAYPHYRGHHQPRLPGALGFYDLRLPAVQAEQIRLARHYGLYGFCYHYYWFGGKRLLDLPLRQMLADPSLDLPFCLCWANENWTRRWDGEDQEILIGQQHSPADDLAFIDALEPILADARYIRVDDKPLLVVYRPQILPDAAATVARWRQRRAARGLPGLFLVAAQSFSDALGADDALFDALVEFPPHTVPWEDIGSQFQLINPRFRGHILDYEAGVRAAEAQVGQPLGKLVFPGVMTAWDNSARRLDNATIFAHASPAAYGRWLSACCRRALAQPRPDHRLVFINAWNEWGEGSYLEPDRRYGHAYLQATQDALRTAAQVANVPERSAHNPRLLYVGHDAHRHGAQLLTLHLLRLFARRFGYRPHLWLLGDGALRADYEALASVEVLDPTPAGLAAAAQRLRAQGYRHALVNTVVSAAALPALAEAGINALALIHEMPQLIHERGLEPNAQAVVDHAEAVVFATTTVRNAFGSLVTLAAERTRLLPQGIYQDLDAPADARAQVAQELGLPADAILVINVGYGDARKGFDLFLDAARLTVHADPRFHFLWLGQVEIGFTPRLERERQQGPLAGHLHQVPFTPAVGRYYAAADLFLLSSREDPFPSVVLEALACGLPVVAFADSGGHCELLDDPRQGLLASPVGDVNALTMALRELAAAEARAPDRRAARAAAARARFDFVTYGWELLRQLDPRLQRVSVVVPNYNYGRYLAARLGSLFTQSYPLFELIVLDDASTDDSRAVIESCQRDWQRDLTLVVNDRNSGSVFAQWRQGIERARGDLIWLAEADDLAMPDFLVHLAPRFAACPELTFAFCDSAQIDGAGQPLGDSYAGYCSERSALDFHHDFRVPAGRFLTEGLAVRNTLLNVSAMLCRRDALQAALARVGPDLARWNIAGDWRLYIELCRGGGQVDYVARPLNQHRRHADSVVGANRLAHHIAEIAAMHAELANDLAGNTRLAQLQQDYLQELHQRASAGE